MSRSPKNKSIGKNSLAQLIAESVKKNGCCFHDEMKGYKGRSIEAAIERAAQGDDGTGKLHAHQRWLQSNTAKQAEFNLWQCAADIKACADKGFDALHKLIKGKLKGVEGAGELYCYDTAFRIGISRGVYPQKVYLHRGTREGAKALGFDEKGKDVLKMSELKKKYPEFAKMKPYQVEDFLCNKKDVLNKFKRP